jgi:hypothetical protein
MNRYIALIFIVFFIACGNKKSTTNDNDNTNNKISQQMTHRKFDIEAFNKHKDESDYWSFTDKNGVEIVQLKLGDGDGFIERQRKPKELFEEYYAYYENGNLKQEAHCFIHNGFFKGEGYFYNLIGELIKVIDYDIPYTYTWENILDFIKKNNIDPYNEHTFIQRYEDKEKGYCWDVMWRIPSELAVNVVILSGEDGRILEKRIDTFEK